MGGSCARGSRLSNRPGRGPSSHAAVGRHGALRGTQRASSGQLGDILFEDSRTVIATLGSTCGRGGAGKPAALPAASKPGSGAARGLGATRQGAAACCRSGGPRPRLRRRRAGPSSSRAGGRGNVAGGGAGARPPTLRGRHPGAPPSDFRDITFSRGSSGTSRRPSAGRRPLRARLPGAHHQDHPHGWRGHLQLRDALRATGGAGAAAALFHAGMPRPLATQALRHASARSDAACIH